MKAVLAAAAFVSGALAEVGAWGQCGGINYSGETTCVSGYTCTYLNDWYSQCIPGSATTTTATSATSRCTITQCATSGSVTSTDTTSSSQPTSTGGSGGSGSGEFKWFGTDESVAEFGESYLPGVYGTHYYWPDTSAIGTLMSYGLNTFRISLRMERMAQGSITADFDEYYLGNLTEVVNYVTSNGAYAVIDPHNYGRYDGSIITSTSDFASWWTKMATAFKDNSMVIFDTNNEYYGLDQQLVLDLNQAAIDAIRDAGATSQYIFVEGNAWSGAWSWTSTNTNLVDLTDPQDMIVYEMHQYLDSDSSGTSESCVSTSIGVERVTEATTWLRDNGKVGIIGEFAGGPNSQCMSAVTNMLDYLQENSDVWMGALWWAAGPWWGDYMFSLEPSDGTAFQYYIDTLAEYAP